MKNSRLLSTIRVILVAAAIFTVLLTAQTQTNAQAAEPPRYRVVGSYVYYSMYDQQYFVTDVPAKDLTVLNYAYISISPNGQCVSTDAWADTQFSYPGDKPTERLRGNFKQIQLLKKDHPDLKVLMSIGGWEQSKYFSDASFNREARIRFGRSCINFMRLYGFDGIDLDWRYPVSGGMEGNTARPEDRDNFTLLLAEFRGQLDYWNTRDKRTYLLTATLPAVDPLYRNFDLAQIPTYLDWINLTTYGYQGSWSELASPQAPLFGSQRDPRGDTVRQAYNVAGTIKAYLDAGVPASKLVMGVALYGQAWSNVKPSDYFGLYQPAKGVPPGTRQGGLLYYRDLVPMFADTSYTHFFDDETKTPWMYSADHRVAISYEDAVSIQNKAAYVRSLGLGGMMIWSLSYDDDAHTLVQAIATSLSDKPTGQ